MSTNVPVLNLEKTQTAIKSLFDAQKKHQRVVSNSTLKERKKKLTALHDALFKYRDAFKESMQKDFKKHSAEVDLTELWMVTSEIKHTKGYLGKWMADQPVDTPLALMGSKSWIQYEAKGVCLIISPWNYPINLTFGPLVSAIAAGNSVILKPSEHTPHTSAVMAQLVKEVFDEREVALVEGGVEASQELLNLPFNHIFFTGAPSIGKIVMAAAAKHLASVTLELGGKSPTIVDETADLKAAANRVTWGKLVNNGQTCIAPDYLYVHNSVKDKFLDLLQKKFIEFYGENASESNDYSRIVNNRHFQRIKGYIEDSVSKGASVLFGGNMDSDQDYIQPTIVTDVPKDSKLMEEEIFGPVLPVIGYDDIEEVIDYINAGEKPLALYVFSKKKKNVKHILQNTSAGGVGINATAMHFGNPNLPFGGHNNSGVGKSHGWFGFKEFSHAKAVYKQILPGAPDMLAPPYNSFKEKMIETTLKWL